MDYDNIKEIVKNTLSEERYYHSICVAKKCKELAKIYNIDEREAILVGIANKEVEIGADYITIPVYKHEINLEKGTREVNGNVISNIDEETRKRLNNKAMKSKGEVSKEENSNTSTPKRGRKPKANLEEKAE